MQHLPNGVAFFDSGIGGLTVLAECQKRISAPFYYYGDNAYAPYGNRPPSEITRRVFSAFSLFADMQVQAAVVACNTATAVCIDQLRQSFSFPVIGIEPAIRPAIQHGGEIFVLTTRATHDSQRFQTLCYQLSIQYPNARIQPFPCERLAGDIERHLLDDGYDCTALLPQGNPNAVVLGCTHYLYMKSQIKAYYRCPIYDGNEGVARRLQRILNPFCEEFRDSQPLLTPNTNSQIYPQISFLGSAKAYNQHVYEQMFGKNRVKNGVKWS